MDPNFDATCDKLDATVFSSDKLADPDNQKGFRAYLERWLRELEEWENLNDEGGQGMKLMYQGETPLNVRRSRRDWLKSVCWDLVGVVITLGAFWIFTILMFSSAE